MGDGVSYSVAATAVITVFLIIAVVFKLGHTLYVRQLELEKVVVVDTSPKLNAAQAVVDVFDLEGSDLGGGRSSIQCERAPAAPTHVLRITGRPQTPVEMLAFQELQRGPVPLIRPSSSDSARPSSSHSGRPNSSNSAQCSKESGLWEPRSKGSEGRRPSHESTAARPEKPHSSGSVWLERPQCRSVEWVESVQGRERRGSVRSENSSDNERPSSAPGHERYGEWWDEAHEWWSEQVEECWDDPYRPSAKLSKSSVQRHRRRDVHDAHRSSLTPESGQPVWPARLQRPDQGAYIWASWAAVEGAPKITQVQPEVVPPRRESPSPFRPGEQHAYDHGDSPWDARPYTAPSKSQQSSSQRIGQAISSPPSHWQTLLEFFAAKAVRKGEHGQRQNLDCQCQKETLVASMQRQLQESASKPLAERKRMFRELQRQLHPDKNMHCADDAKLAFQELMQQRMSYLAEH